MASKKQIEALTIPKVTRDRSVLLKAHGFWSEKEILFNPTPDIVLLDPALNAAGLLGLIEDYKQTLLASDIAKEIKRGCERNNTDLLGLMTRKTSYLKERFKLQCIPAFDRPENRGGENVEWALVSQLFARENPQPDAQVTELATMIANAAKETVSVIRWNRGTSARYMLLHPTLTQALRGWSNHNVSIETILDIVSSALWGVIHNQQLIGFNKWRAQNIEVVNLLKRAGVQLSNVERQREVIQICNFSNACGLLLARASAKGLLVLPAYCEPKRLLWNDRRIESFNHPTHNEKYGTFLRRMLLSSTMQTPADIPLNIWELLDKGIVPNRGVLNTMLVPVLRDYAREHEFSDLKPFPLEQLHGQKRRRKETPAAWSLAWLRAQDIPAPWLRFAEIADLASDAGDKFRAERIHHVLGWAWFERRFACPADVKVTDLCDPHRPSRHDTLQASIQRLDTNSKWERWNNIEYVFGRVFNTLTLEPESVRMLLPTNPFANIDNPFRSAARNKTPRGRLPTVIHEAMLQVLLSPDENGNATFSFVRDTLGWDWFNWRNPQTEEYERVWCPSRATALAFELLLPPRNVQVRWLDEGLMDTHIWDLDRDAYIENTHPLKDWKHPSGCSHLDLYRRNSGILQPAYDPVFGTESICIFINTNKTQMWDPSRKTGYELLWPRGDELGNVPESQERRRWLSRPYEVIEYQMRFVKKYDPRPTPVTFIDAPDDAERVNKKFAEQLPYFVPVFRDLTGSYSRGQEEIYIPVTRAKIEMLFSALAVETEERLRAEGIKATLTKAAKGNDGYKGRKCLFDMHSLRVAGITRLIEMGVPMHIIAEFFSGHATIAQVVHYQKHEIGYIHKRFLEAAKQAEVLGDFEALFEKIIAESSGFLVGNIAYGAHVPPDLAVQRPWSGWKTVDGGACPLGGTACEIGMLDDINNEITSRDNWVPVRGCGNCRFFMSGPPFMLQQAHKLNELMIELRTMAKQVRHFREREFEITLPNERQNIIEKREIRSKTEEIERQMEPLVREWYNRYLIFQESLEKLDDWNALVRQHRGSGERAPLMLVSHGTNEQIDDQLSIASEKVCEFTLVRETLRQAQLTGGLERAGPLPKAAILQFIDRILVEEDPKHLLVSIRDEKTRLKAAYLLAEALATMAGDDAVQDAFDHGTKLHIPNQQVHCELMGVVREVIDRARRSNQPTLEEPMQSTLHDSALSDVLQPPEEGVIKALAQGKDSD